MITVEKVAESDLPSSTRANNVQIFKNISLSHDKFLGFNPHIIK